MGLLMRSRSLRIATTVCISLVMAIGAVLAFSRWQARRVADDYMSPKKDILRYFHTSLIPTFSPTTQYHLPFWEVTYIQKDMPGLYDPLPFVHVSLDGQVIDARPSLPFQR